MKLHEFKNYELSEENILRVYKRCKATGPVEKPIKVKVFYPHLCGQDSPEITFDGYRILANYASIYHMLGQLKAVHDGQPFMASKQGFINYKGQKWTEKTSAVSALYALGIATTSITPFVKDAGMKYSVTDIRVLKPTYTHDDPNYSKNPLPMPENELDEK